MEQPQLSVKARICGTPARNRTFQLPDVLSDVIDELIDRADEQGYSVNRAELVAALVTRAANSTGKEVEEAVREYRLASVGSVVTNKNNDGFVTPRMAGRGPRKRRI